jgi:prepilin-type N-terminal cleavage/methylation domain-containing protein
MTRRAFTLIELIIVVIVIAILAAIGVPIFVAMQEDASRASEDAVIAALRSASSTYTGTHGMSYDENPFDLLEIAPPNIMVAYGTELPAANGMTWRIRGDGIWGRMSYNIFCPHYNSEPNVIIPGFVRKGRSWIYIGNYVVGGGVRVPEGAIREGADYGH